MLDIYKGIKIDDEIIIVENSHGQGYVVSKGNNSQLTSAMNWARNTHTVLDENGKEKVEYYYYYDENHKVVHTQDYDPSYYCKYIYETVEGVAHTYENGKFKLSLCMSAMGSSQGGKLSFWNCTITAPDGKEFLIGINSECLLQLLLNNTFINGVCQANVWLGRIKSNVGAFTENMDEFEQGKKDKAIREGKKTSNYNVGAILLPSENVYCGKFFKTFDIWSEDHCNTWLYSRGRITNQFVNIFTKPKARYLYERYESVNKSDCIFWRHDFKQTKATGVVADETATVNVPMFWENTKKYISGSIYSQPFYKDTLQSYQKATEDTVDMPDPYTIMRLMYVQDEDVSGCDVVANLIEFCNKYSIPYKIDADDVDLENNYEYIKVM